MGEAIYTEVPFGASTTDTNKQGSSCCGGCCDMVSNEISIPMVVEDEKAAGQDKSNKIILIKNFVARRSSYSTINFSDIFAPSLLPYT
eukprot:scaffold500_cov210-Chaetoceros_neogracile.AAC.1